MNVEEALKPEGTFSTVWYLYLEPFWSYLGSPSKSSVHGEDSRYLNFVPSDASASFHSELATPVMVSPDAYSASSW